MDMVVLLHTSWSAAGRQLPKCQSSPCTLGKGVEVLERLGRSELLESSEAFVVSDGRFWRPYFCLGNPASYGGKSKYEPELFPCSSLEKEGGAGLLGSFLTLETARRGNSLSLAGQPMGSRVCLPSPSSQPVDSPACLPSTSLPSFLSVGSRD